MMIEIEDIKRLNLSSDDILVIKTPVLSMEAVQRLSSYIKQHIDNKVLFLAPGYDLEVLELETLKSK